MYKIYFKRGNSSRNIFEPYTEEVVFENIETGKSETNNIEWATDDLAELAEKYKELLVNYTTEQLRVIEELDVDVLVSIMNG